MEIHPEDLGTGYAKEVIVQRGKGTINILHAFCFRAFFWRSTGFSYSDIQQILQRTIQPIGFRDVAFKLPVFVFASLSGIALCNLVHSGSRPYDPSRLPVLGTSLQGAVASVLVSVLAIIVWQTRSFHDAFLVPLTERQAFEMQQVFASPPPAALAYAYLVQEMVAAENVPPAAQQELRDALRLVGEAVHTLSTAAARKFTAPSYYSQCISHAAYRAECEPDPVIKEAVLREVESYRQAHAAAKDNAATKHRSEALLQALQAQIEALRATLPTFASNTVPQAQLSQISESAHSITRQVAAQLNAYRELDTTTTVTLGQR